MKFNERYDRHLIAKKHFKPGDIIFMEKPYTTFLNINKAHASCFHFFKTALGNEGCLEKVP